MRRIAELEQALAEARGGQREAERKNRQWAETSARRQRELIELTEKFQQRDETCRQLQRLVAGLGAGNTVAGQGGREGLLSEQLQQSRAAGDAIALKAVSFCELVEQNAGSGGLGKVSASELALKTDELKRLGRRFIGMAAETGNAQKLERCRVLSVNRELSFAILPVGSRQGAFNGLLLHSGKGKVTLRIVGVRPDVAAAVPISGSIEDLAPGMEAVTDENRGTTETD